MGNRIEVQHPDPRRGIVMFAFRTLYGMVVRPCNFNPLLFSSPASQALHQFGRRITGNFAVQTTNREKMPRRKPQCENGRWF